MLELGELGAGERNTPLMWAEVHKHGVVFDAEYDAESVLVVGHLIVDGERLGRRRRSRGAERAVGQVAPGCGAGCLHSYHHAPSGAQTGYARIIFSGRVLSRRIVLVRRSHQGAPVVYRSVSKLVSTDVAARRRCGHL